MVWWTSLIGPAIGALAGGGDDEQTSTSKNEPWAAAQPFMLRNLQDTEKLGNYYKQNPFNQQQVESYSNLFGDNQNFRQNIAPGLMDFANRGMTGGYQRQRVNRPGDVAGYGGQSRQRTPMQRPSAPSGGLLGPFSVGQGGQGAPAGLLDLNGAQNPFANGAITQNPQTVTEQMVDELRAAVAGLSDSPGNDAGDNQGQGGGTGGVNDGFKGMQDMINTPYGTMTIAVAQALGLLGSRQTQAPAPVQDGPTNGWGGGQLGVGGDLGGGTYGGGGIDYGNW